VASSKIDMIYTNDDDLAQRSSKTKTINVAISYKENVNLMLNPSYCDEYHRKRQP